MASSKDRKTVTQITKTYRIIQLKKKLKIPLKRKSATNPTFPLLTN